MPCDSDAGARHGAAAADSSIDSVAFIVDDGGHGSDSTEHGDGTDSTVADNAGEDSDYDVIIIKAIAFMLTIMVVTIIWI